jgi:hypothetical protein
MKGESYLTAGSADLCLLSQITKELVVLVARMGDIVR